MLLYTVVCIALNGKEGAFSCFHSHRNCVWHLTSFWVEGVLGCSGVWAQRSMSPGPRVPSGQLAPATIAVPSERNSQPRFKITRLKPKPPGLFQTTSGRGVCTRSRGSGGRTPRGTSGQTSPAAVSLTHVQHLRGCPLFQGRDSEPPPPVGTAAVCGSPSSSLLTHQQSS